jgi:hypothetical protein
MVLHPGDAVAVSENFGLARPRQTGERAADRDTRKRRSDWPSFKLTIKDLAHVAIERFESGSSLDDRRIA